MYKKIIFNEPDFTKIFLKLSNEAKDLILKLLDKNQKSRLKVGQIKQHPFFNNFNFQEIYNMTAQPPFKIDGVKF